MYKINQFSSTYVYRIKIKNNKCTKQNKKAIKLGLYLTFIAFLM